MDITEEVIKHLSNNIKTKLAVSSIDGIGVFAIMDIQKGDEVFPIWTYNTGIYVIPNDRLPDIPAPILELLDMYFINDECDFKIIRLFKGFNFTFHGFSYCNSAYTTKHTQNISNDGIALRDIKAGE